MIQRPCLACGSENDGSAVACGRCRAPLTAWAQRLPATTPSRSVRRLPSRRSLLLLGLLASLGIAFGPAGWTYLAERGRAPEGPTWRDPASIAAWAADELHADGVEPASVDARIEKRTSSPRRLVITGHPTGQGLLDVVRATGRLLLAARDKGEATATHLAIVRQGTRVLLLPIGDAARVAKSDEGAAAWLDEQERLRPGAAGGDDDGPTILMGPTWPPPLDSALFLGPPSRPSQDALPAATPVAPAPAPSPAAVVAATPSPAPAPPPVTPPRVTTPPVATASKTPDGTTTAPPVRVLKTTAGGPIASRAQPAQEGVVLLRFQIHPGTRRALRLDGLSLRARGTLPDVEDISFVDLFRDVDRDGKRGPADTRLGSRQSFADDDGKLDFENLGIAFGEDGTGLELIVTTDFADESLGGTVLLAMQDPSFLNVTETTSNLRCGVRGVPLTGPVISVDANVQEDPEQARLDALAEAGPEAVDERLMPPTSRPVPEGEVAESASGPEGESGASGATGPTGPAAGPIAPISPFPRRR